MLKAPSVQALLAAVRLKAVKASHSKAIFAVSVQSKIRSVSKGEGRYKTLGTAGSVGQAVVGCLGRAPDPLWPNGPARKVMRP